MILVIGEILFDVFPDEKKMGGAPFNFAFHLKKLGLPVRFASRVGQDADGQKIINFLDRHGFHIEDVSIDPDRATGTVTVTLNPDGSHDFTINPDAAWDHIPFKPHLSSLLNEKPDLLYFGSLIQRTKTGRQLIEKILEQKPDHTRVFCDINLRPNTYSIQTIHTCLAAANILKLSHEELVEIAGFSAVDPALQENINKFMKKYRINMVILTRGSQGSQWFTNQTSHDIAPVELSHIADTVGAGDAYAALSAAGLLFNLPIAKAAGLADEFAGIICGTTGALPDDEGIYTIFKQKLK